jgi:hypothetical protein
MTLTLPAWIGAVATVVLAAGAWLAVLSARRAVRQQSRIFGTLQRLAQDQAQLLRVELSQIEAQRAHFRDQRRVYEAQVEALARLAPPAEPDDAGG